MDKEQGLREWEESTVIYTFLAWIVMDDGAIYVHGVIYEKTKQTVEWRLVMKSLKVFKII